MPKVTEEYRLARRQEIADAALRAFRRKGFHATSMAEIITESGLSAGAIYGHYPSKDALVMDVAARIIEARVDDLKRLSALDPMPAPPTLPRTLVGSMGQDLGSPGVLLQLWGEAVTEPAVRDLVCYLVDALRSTLARYISLWHQRTYGTAEAEADALGAEQSVLFVGAAQGFVVQATLLPGFDAEAYFAAQEKYLPR